MGLHWLMIFKKEKNNKIWEEWRCYLTFEVIEIGDSCTLLGLSSFPCFCPSAFLLHPFPLQNDFLQMIIYMTFESC